MIQLKTEHANTVIEDFLANLEMYTVHLRQVRESRAYDASESSLNLPGDAELLERVEAVVSEKVTPALKYSVVAGIGGSNLGTKAIYDAMFGRDDVLEPERFPKMLFAETTDPEWLAKVVRLLKTISAPEEVLVTVISKSGGTTETIANFEVIMQALHEKLGDITKRVVVITDEGSKLWDAAIVKGIAHLPIPAPVGGRYSVFSAVGLLPLRSVGVDVNRLRDGAREMLDQCFSGDNIAARSAVVLATQHSRGFHINDNFFFHPELESVGKWYRQLMGESVGKEQSLNGETVHAGITPTVSLGSTDLHSVGQLYLGGPKDKLTTFVFSRQSEAVDVPSRRVFPDLVPMIDGKSANDIMTAILEGVKIAYIKAGLPFMEVSLDEVDEQSIGAYLQFKMLEMMYLGQLLNVNSFDQPNVESYKIETKRLLEA
jgi:glucose-6-phosphate isomerase